MTAGGDLTGPFGNLQIAPNAVTGAEIDESTLNDGEVVFADYDAAGSRPLIDFGFGTLVGECTANATLRGFKLTVTGPATSFSQVVLTGRATGETPMGGGPANVTGPLSPSIAFTESGSANRPWNATISVRDAEGNGGRQVEILANGFTKDAGGNGCRTWLRVLR